MLSYQPPSNLSHFLDSKSFADVDKQAQIFPETISFLGERGYHVLPGVCYVLWILRQYLHD
jgi:hypothetical protein